MGHLWGIAPHPGTPRCSGTPRPERDAESPPRLPRRRPCRKWPPVFANIVARGWEGLGPPQRAPLCRADPQGLISIPPGHSPRSFQRRQALLLAPPACRSPAEVMPSTQLCPSPAPFPCRGARACVTGVPCRCACRCPVGWLLSWSVLVGPSKTHRGSPQNPPRVPVSVHARTGARARSCTGCRAQRCVRPSTHLLHAQLRGCTHSCTPASASSSLARPPTPTPAVRTPPCTLPALRLPQIPPLQLTKVPRAGRQLCPAWHNPSPRHRDVLSGSGLPTAPSTLPATPAVGSPRPL